MGQEPDLEGLKERLGRLELDLVRLTADVREMRRACMDLQGEAPAVELASLSRREMEVVRLLLEGRRVASISKQLSVSPHTTRNHLKSIFRKVGVHSQAELVDLLQSRAGGREI